MLKPKGQRKAPWPQKTRAFIEWCAKNTNLSFTQIARLASKVKRKETGDTMPVAHWSVGHQTVEKGWRSGEQIEWSNKKDWIPPRTREYIKKALERKKLTFDKITRNVHRMYFSETGAERKFARDFVSRFNKKYGIRDSETIRQIVAESQRPPIVKKHTVEEKERLLNENSRLISWVVTKSREKTAKILRGIAIELNLPLQDLVERARIIFLERIDYWNPQKGTLSTYLAQQIPGILLNQLKVGTRQPKIRESRFGIDNRELPEERDSNFGTEQNFNMEKIALQQTLKRLPLSEIEERTVSLLLQGRSQQEIAEMDGVTRSAVNIRVKNIRNKLKDG